MQKKLYQITLVGCDGMTDFVIQLSDEEKALVDKICGISKKIGGGCSPTMKIESYIEE